MSGFQQEEAEQQHKARKIRSFGVLIFVLLILLFGTYLRFHNLGVQSLWNDEGNSYVQATRSADDIALNAARDIHPPGYYWMLAFWRRSTGDSEFAFRAFSTFASILTIAFTFALGKRLFSPLTGLIAALLVTLNTFSIYYAQEARMYALLAMWSAGSMWALAGILKLAVRHTWKGYRPLKQTSPAMRELHYWGVLLGFVNAAGLYTQYAYPFIMIAQGVIVIVWLVIAYWKRLKSALLSPALSTFLQANLMTILIFLPWLPTAVRQVTSWPSTGQTIPVGEALQTIGDWFMFGLTYSYPLESIDSAVLIVALTIFALVLGGVGAWNIHHKRVMLWRVMLPVLWVIVPVGLFLILGLFRPANLKLLLPSQVGFALFVALGLGRFWEGFKGWGIGIRVSTKVLVRQSLIGSRILAGLLTLSILYLVAAAIPPLYTDVQYQRSDYRGMVAAITANPRSGDAVILDAPNQEEVFRYYYRGDAPIFALPPGLGGNDAETLTAVQDIIARYDRIFVLFWGETERDPNHIVETTLDSQTFQAGEEVWYGDVRFAVYAPPAQMPASTASNARFGEQITLVNYALNVEVFRPGDVLQTVFNWQTDALLNNGTTYKIFLQLLNSNGVLVVQRDTIPVSGSRPTDSWQPGEMITDRHGLALPADLPPGDYQLILGLYDLNNPARRLPVGDTDYLTLATIHIQ